MRRFVLPIFATMLMTNCNQKNQTSAVKTIATSSNEALVKRLEEESTVKLTEILNNHEIYGIGEKEKALIEENLAEVNLEKVVVAYLDPNNKQGETPPRWVWVPSGEDDDALKSIEAVTKKDEQIDIIDGTQNPENVPYPIITLSLDETLNIPSSTPTEIIEGSEGESALMLESIQLENDHEPWIKGAAEIYLVVTYYDKEGKAATEIIGLPSVDYAGQVYYPRNLIHLWPKNKYQIANVSVFEADSGHDYSDLIKAFTAAVSGVATAVIDPTLTTTLSVMGTVATLADAIVDGMPKDTFTDSDDFVDSIYTIEKYQDETYIGTGGNATLEISHFELKINDE